MSGFSGHSGDDNRLRYLATALAFFFALLLCILLWPRKTSSSVTGKKERNPSSPESKQASTDKGAPTNVSIEPIIIDFSNATNALTLYSPNLGLKKGQEGNPESLPIKASPGNKAITKGSFTVWTVPEDPNPGQPYWIVIQVKHKKTLVNYTRVDLTGTVVGTDNYRARITSHQPANLWVKDNIARLALLIPGGAKLVKDIINIKSSMLNEKQTVAITF